MIKKTLYFGNPTYLSCTNEQLVIEMPEITKANTHPSLQAKGVITRPIEDIGLVMLDHPQITITHGAIQKLLQNTCAIITCDSKRLPFGLCLPLYGNTTQNERFRDQLAVARPVQKQLWQQTIQYKIRNQAFIIQKFTSEEAENMLAWAKEVRSGDVTNLEARAAAFYWKNVFHQYPDFLRDRDGLPPNNLLNYGYAILRAVIARAIVLSGLIPTLGINHHNKYNAYCLADDIMEPYRPYVDKKILQLLAKYGHIDEITKEIKGELLLIPTMDVKIGKRRSPLMIAASQTTASLYQCFIGKTRKIDYPLME